MIIPMAKPLGKAALSKKDQIRLLMTHECYMSYASMRIKALSNQTIPSAE